MVIVMFQVVVTYGGSSRSLVEVGRRLQEREGVEVHVVDVYGQCDRFAEAVAEAGLRREVLLPGGGLGAVGARSQPIRRTLRLLSRGPEVLRIAKAAKRRLREIGADVVISNDFRTLLPLCLPGISQARKYVWLRGWWTPDMFTCYCRWMAKRKLAGMLAVSHQTATAVRSAGAPAEKVHVVHNPIDVEDIRQRSQRPLAAEVPQDDRAVKLLLPANLYPTKGHETAIRATSLLAERGMDLVLWMAGAIKAAHERYHKEMCEVARQVGAEANIEWLGLRDDIPQLMARSTAVVLPTYREGHPRVSLEAMALGIPFISTPAGGVLDMVLPGVTGWLHDIGDAEGLAECVQEVVSNPERAKVVAETGRDYVRDQFRPEHQLQALRKAFQSVVGRSRR